MMAARLNFEGRKFILKCDCKYEYAVEVLAWLPSFIPMGLIDLFVGLSQANPNPNNRSFQGPQPTALKKRMAQVKTFKFCFVCFLFLFF